MLGARRRESLSQSRLDIAERVRTNLLPWNGQFSPQLVEGLLRAYAHRGAMVLDPFVGGGTLLVEAARLGLASCGSDLNPAAGLRNFHLISILLRRFAAAAKAPLGCFRPQVRAKPATGLARFAGYAFSGTLAPKRCATPSS